MALIDQAINHFICYPTWYLSLFVTKGTRRLQAKQPNISFKKESVRRTVGKEIYKAIHTEAANRIFYKDNTSL